MKDTSFNSKISIYHKNLIEDIKETMQLKSDTKINNKDVIEYIIDISLGVIENDINPVNNIMNLKDKVKKAHDLLAIEDIDGVMELDSICNVESLMPIADIDIKILSEINLPAIIVIKDCNDIIMDIVGTDNLAKSLIFIEKALNKGRENKNISSEALIKRYKNNSDIYIKFRNLSKIDNLKFELVSLDHPSSVKGQAIMIQLLKENKNAYNNIADFINK